MSLKYCKSRHSSNNYSALDSGNSKDEERLKSYPILSTASITLPLSSLEYTKNFFTALKFLEFTITPGLLINYNSRVNNGSNDSAGEVMCRMLALLSMHSCTPSFPLNTRQCVLSYVHARLLTRDVTSAPKRNGKKWTPIGLQCDHHYSRCTIFNNVSIYLTPIGSW